MRGGTALGAKPEESHMPGTVQVDASWQQVGGENVCVLRVSGTVDASGVVELEKGFSGAQEAGARCFVLDFSKMEYISSAGLRVLLKLRKAALGAGGRVLVAALRREIRENVFSALGFSHLFDVYATADEAIEALKGVQPPEP